MKLSQSILAATSVQSNSSSFGYNAPIQLQNSETVTASTSEFFEHLVILSLYGVSAKTVLVINMSYLA